MTTKTCSMCGEIKPSSEFHRNKNTSTGLGSQCKPCANERKRTRRELAATKEATWAEREREQKAARSSSIGLRRYEFHKEQADRLRSTMGSLVAYHEAEAAKYQSYSEVGIVE